MRLFKKLIKMSQLHLAAMTIFAGACLSLAQESDSDVAAPKGIVLDDGSENIQAQQLFSNYILKNENDNFSIKLTDSDAKSSLHRLAKEAEVNIVIPEDLDSRININLSDVNFDLALKAILKSTPYRYTLDEGIYFIEIASSKHIEAEQVFSKRFPIVNANIDDVYIAISEAYGSSEGAASTEATEGGESEAAIDTPTQASVNIILDKSNSAIVAQGSQEVLAQIEDLIKLLDLGPEQVMIEAAFVDVNVTDTDATGIDWSAFQAYTLSVNTAWDSIFGQGSSVVFGIGDTPGTDSVVLSSAGNTALLNFLLSQDDNKLVSKPRVITSSSVEAKMSVGLEYPIPEFEVNDETGNVSVSGFDYREIGVILNVTPKVNADRSVTLEVSPEISSQGANVVAGGFNIPVINYSRMESTLTIAHGETMVMGGLISDDYKDTQNKVPLLGDLPFIGKAFRSSSKNITKRNLMIFMTVHLIPSKGSLGDIMSDDELIELRMDKNDFLPYDKREKKIEAPANFNSNAKKVEAREVSEVRATSF